MARRRQPRARAANARAITEPTRSADDVHLEGFPTVDGLRQVATRAAGSLLAQYLLHPERSAVVVVITIHPAAQTPYIDARALAEELRGIAELYVVSADASFGVTDALGNARLSAFYGAGRTYPPGTAWLDDMHVAPLRMCPSPAAASRAGHAIRDDALRLALASGAFDAPVRADEDVPCQATVAQILNEQQAMVQIEGGGAAVVWAHHVYPEVPASRLLTRGMTLHGWNRGSGHLTEFIPKRPDDDSQVRLRGEYDDGDVVLVRVREVDTDQASVELHPEVHAKLTAATGTDLTTLIRAGDVVATEIALIDDEWQADFAEGEEPRPAISVLPGGPPWLHPADIEPAPQPGVGSDAGDDGAAMLGAGTSSDDALDLRAQLDQARVAVDEYATQVDQLQAEVTGLQGQLKAARSALRRADKSRLRLPVVYDDPQEQWRFEMWLAYLQRVPASDRGKFPWPEDFVIGPHFIESVNSLQGISHQKIVEVAAEIVCDLVREMPGRELHPWLVKRAGEQETRSDGATAWRVALQKNSPGARRLKFWRLKTGGVELDSVGHHDDGLR